METCQRSRSAGVGLHVPSHRHNLHYHHRHHHNNSNSHSNSISSRASLPIEQKARWQKIEDDDDDDKVNAAKKKRKKIMKRNLEEDSEKPMLNGNSRRPFSSLGIGAMDAGMESGSQNALTSKKAMQELKFSTLMKPRMTPRNCASAMGVNDEQRMRNQKLNLRTQVLNGDENDPTTDLDFTEKLKAFRALVSLKKKSGRDSNKDNGHHAKAFAEKLEANGKFLKFNSQSLERKEIQSSSPTYFLDEFQMSFEQDKEFNRKRLLTNDVNRTLDNDFIGEQMHSRDFRSVSGRDTNSMTLSYGYSPDNESAIGETNSLGQDDYHHRPTEKTPRKPCIRVIKRPTSHVEYDNANGVKMEENLQYSLNEQGIPYSSENRKNFSGHFFTPLENDAQSSSRDTGSMEKVVRDAAQFEHSDKAFTRSRSRLEDHVPRIVSKERPASVSRIYHDRMKDDNSSVADENRALTGPRPRSAVLVSDRAYYSGFDPSYVPGDPVRKHDGVITPDSSLKAHLNILGASLSSLSSRLNGDSSDSDGRSLTSDLEHRLSRSSSMSTLTASNFKGGVGGTQTEKRLSLQKRISESDFDVRHVGVSLRDRHHLHTMTSPVSFDPSSQEQSLRNESPYQHSGTNEFMDPSDEFSSAKGRPQSLKAQTESGKPKQTNVTLTSISNDSSLYQEDEERQSIMQNHATDSPSADKLNRLKKKQYKRTAEGEDDAELSDDEISSFSSIREHQKDLHRTADYIARQRVRGHPKVKAVIGRNSKNIDSDEEIDTAIELENTLTEQDMRPSSISPFRASKDINKTRGESTRKTKDLESSGQRRVISRKMPINKDNKSQNDKGAYIKSAMVDIPKEKGGDSEPVNSKSTTVKHSPEKKRILVKRPSDLKSGHGHQHIINGPVAIQENVSPKASNSRRSHSSQGISRHENQSQDEKARVQRVRTSRDSHEGRRPHSCLGHVSSAAKARSTSTPRKLKSSGRESAASYDFTLKTENLDHQQKALPEKLFDKVQRLHKEIDERLMSEENATHKYRLRKRLPLEDDSSDDVDGEDTITNGDVNLQTPESSSNTPHRGRAFKRSKGHKTETVLTSTPLKSKPDVMKHVLAEDQSLYPDVISQISSTRQTRNSLGSEILTPSPRMGTKSLNLNVLPDSPRIKLSDRIKEVIAARNRFTPDIATIQRRSQMYTKNNDNNIADDDDDDDDKSSGDESYRGYYRVDDDKDEDETQISSWRHRSGSVGSKHTANKKDFVSRILGKMAGKERTSSSDDVMASIFTSRVERAMYDSNQRPPSPADTLLTYLDNPHMVNLLQKLYKADPLTRQIIMVKVQYFKAWQQYSVKAKQKRLKKESMQESAEAFCYQRLLALHFSTWESRATHSCNMRRALALFRTHMLVKGFRALKWSVSHSRHQTDQLQAKVHRINTQSAFYKWKGRAEKHRRDRIQTAMQRWKQFVTEAQKIRHMQNLMDCNTMTNVFMSWKKRYSKRVKDNLAFQYLRRTMLKHTLTTWCGFIAMSKRKKEKYISAVSLHQKNLLQSTFYHMVISYKKSKKARVHFKQQKLTEVFWAWKEASQICRSERKADMEASVQHWQKQCVKQTFVQWKEKLMLCKADKHSVVNLCKNVFHVWTSRWQRRVTQREEIEAAIEKNKLHRALLTWRRNVVQIKRSHKQAVRILEKCHLHHTLRAWRMYSIMRTTLKRKIFLHQYTQQRRIQASCFVSWLVIFRQRMDEVKARELWSNSCARKIGLHWKIVCHKRSLERQLEESHTDRQLRFMQAMFNRWLHALDRNEREKEEAEDVRKTLQLCTLQRKFQFWKIATQKQLLIKPLVIRRENHNLSQVFNGWHFYVRKVVCCRQSKVAFEKLQLAKAFTSWRSHSKAHDVEKQVKASMVIGLLLCYLQEWRYFVWRKKECLRFRQIHLVKNKFLFWKGRTASQCSLRAKKEEEEESNLELKRACFNTWRENTNSQRASYDQCVESLVTMQDTLRLKNSFGLWRRQMHSAIIARSYQKTACMRLVQTLFSAWHDLTTKNLSHAVSHFAEKIGLVADDDPTLRDGRGHLKRCSSIQGDEVDFNAVLEDGDMMSASLNGSLSSTFSVGSSARRLFCETERSVDSDVDRHFLLSGGIQDIMDEHAAKCHRLRESVTNAIIRLQHWPVYPAFQQWVEFTVRQRNLKETARRVQDLVIQMETKSAFRQWKNIYLALKTSKQHSNFTILSSNFGALVQYCRHRKYVKDLSTRAHRYCMLIAFQKFFPIWLSKTQKQRQEKHVMELWTTRTEREMELFPLESKLKQRFGSKTVRLCFSIWLLKYRHFEKIQRVYHTNILKWLFDTWKQWASQQHCLRINMDAMRKKRQSTLALQTWKKRFHQSRETERKFQLSSKRRLQEIFVKWHLWAKDTKQRDVSFKSILHQQSQHLLSCYLSTWKTLAERSKSIKANHQVRLICSVFKEWRSVTQVSKTQEGKVLSIQVLSYTLLVKRLFHHWHCRYTQRRLEKEEKLKQAESTALKLAVTWRQKCQKARGRHLHQIFQQRQMLSCFQKWKCKHDSVLCLYDKMEHRLQERNQQTLRCFLKQWITRLHGDQASRLFQCKLLCTMLKEWCTFARENRERRIRGLALQKALQERSLHVYFHYWKALTRVKKSIQQNADTKLQMKIFSAWSTYTRNICYLRNLQEHMTQQVNTRILSNAFTNLRWRAEYCQNLKEVADRMMRDRTDATLRAVIVLWKDRLDRINAARCYGHILAARTSRQWCRFVAKRKAKREKNRADLEKAVHFDQRQICKRAFQALRMEVAVSKMAQKRRQRLCDKYAKIWKFRVDLTVTALEMEWDMTCKHAWSVWRKAYCKRMAVKQVARKEQDIIKSQIFKAWLKKSGVGRKLARKSPQPMSFSSSRRASSTSLLPVPVGQTRSSTLSSPSSSLLSSSSHSSQPVTHSSTSQHFRFRAGKNV